jgi:hypothetical protein
MRAEHTLPPHWVHALILGHTIFCICCCVRRMNYRIKSECFLRSSVHTTLRTDGQKQCCQQLTQPMDDEHTKMERF